MSKNSNPPRPGALRRITAGYRARPLNSLGTPYPSTDKTDKTPDEWLRIIEEDLRAEGTTFAKVERGMLARLPVKRRKPTEAALRQRQFNTLYMREFTPGADTPAGPCLICGDRVSHKLASNSPWRCRSCEMPNARLEVHRWFVAPVGAVPAPSKRAHDGRGGAWPNSARRSLTRKPQASHEPPVDSFVSLAPSHPNS